MIESMRNNKLTNNINNICNVWMSNSETYQALNNSMILLKEEEHRVLTSIKVSTDYSLIIIKSRLIKNLATYFD